MFLLLLPAFVFSWFHFLPENKKGPAGSRCGTPPAMWFVAADRKPNSVSGIGVTRWRWRPFLCDARRRAPQARQARKRACSPCDLPADRLAPGCPDASGSPRAGAVRIFGLAAGGVCRADDVTTVAVRSYRTISPLP